MLDGRLGEMARFMPAPRQRCSPGTGVAPEPRREGVREAQESVTTGSAPGTRQRRPSPTKRRTIGVFVGATPSGRPWSYWHDGGCNTAGARLAWHKRLNQAPSEGPRRANSPSDRAPPAEGEGEGPRRALPAGWGGNGPSPSWRRDIPGAKLASFWRQQRTIAALIKGWQRR
jgi:hypothetical protein